MLKYLYLKLPPYLLSIVVLGGILWLTLAPDPTGGARIPLFAGADKIVHFAMFFGLALCLAADFHYHAPCLNIARASCIGGGVSAFVGCFIEFLQSYMELGRSFELADMLADAVGAIVAAVLFSRLQKHNK